MTLSRKVSLIQKHTDSVVLKSGVVDSVLSFAKFKAEQQLAKTGGSKRARLSGFMKLDDANKAGTKDGYRCTLILTEGDSAKALTTSGLGIVGRDLYGGKKKHHFRISITNNFSLSSSWKTS